MKEVTYEQVLERLHELGQSEEHIQEIIDAAKERSTQADAVYLNRRGTDRLFECTVIQCQFVNGVAHWFMQD